MRALLAEVAGRRLALPLDLVRKVLPAVLVTPIANAPYAVLGVIQIRGRVHAVVSVERALGLGPGEVSPDHHFVLARLGALNVALHVTRALSVIDLDETAVVPLGDVLPGRPPSGGVARTDSGLVVVHDLPSFLSLDDAATFGGGAGA